MAEIHVNVMRNLKCSVPPLPRPTDLAITEQLSAELYLSARQFCILFAGVYIFTFDSLTTQPVARTTLSWNSRMT